jgi:signal transduction histidine kinase
MKDKPMEATIPHEGASQDPRVKALFDQRYEVLAKKIDTLLSRLLVVQWLCAIIFAYWFSPLAWAGKQSAMHAHVFAAFGIGGVITALPVFMVWRYPGIQATRYVVASAQMLWSALLIHLTGGRIETHFHIFCSLGILAFYRDLKILIPASVIIAVDHFVRGIVWPESVYGVINPEWWRFLEHAWWVVFLDAFLLYNCVVSYRELWAHCEQQIELEDAQSATSRYEKLAAIGQLAASVGHELRNPLSAIRNAHTFIDKSLTRAGQSDPRIHQFLGIMLRELDASSKIIGNLLEFSRPKDPIRHPCPLGPLTDEAISIVPPRPNVELINEVPEDIPIPDLDKDQFRQVLINLIQNASEAIPADREGKVRVRARKHANGPWEIRVTDNGDGIPPEVIQKIFQPLFSTKTKGTGLGLAVVRGMVERHGGTLDVEHGGTGATFLVSVPTATAQPRSPEEAA